MDRLKIKILMAIICSLVYGSINSQSKHDYNWVLRNTVINFNGDTVAIVKDTNIVHNGQNSMTINNSNGELLGYSNGCRIYNMDYTIVEGTDSLNFSDFAFYDDFCTSQFHRGYPSGQQSMMILPSGSEFYLLHEIAGLNLENDFFTYSENVFGTKLSFDNDLVLDFIQQPIILDDSVGVASTSAVKHQNNYDWWIVKHDLNSACYYKVLFKNGQFSEAGYQCLGDENSVNGDGGGGAKFSPQGDKYARFTPIDALFIFDFNRETGILSNYEYIDIPQTGLTGGISSLHLVSFYMYQILYLYDSMMYGLRI